MPEVHIGPLQTSDIKRREHGDFSVNAVSIIYLKKTKTSLIYLTPPHPPKKVKKIFQQCHSKEINFCLVAPKID